MHRTEEYKASAANERARAAAAADSARQQQHLKLAALWEAMAGLVMRDEAVFLFQAQQTRPGRA